MKTNHNVETDLFLPFNKYYKKSWVSNKVNVAFIIE